MTAQITLNATGELVSLHEADQFQRAASGAWLSQFECGYFTAAMFASMADTPGGEPTLSVAEVAARAEAWYSQYNGNNAISNTAGMTNAQEYDLLLQLGIHFQALTALDSATASAWLRAGYPLMAGVLETSVVDLALARTPYPWTPAGSHIFAITGLAHDGVNFLVRDAANCTSLYDPASLRPGPRTYSARSLRFVSLTVIVPPWLPRPTDGKSAPPPAIIGGSPMLQLSDLADVYVAVSGSDDVWQLKGTSLVIGHAILRKYRSAGAAPYYGYGLFGKPRGNEQSVVGSKQQDAVLQVFERAVLGYHVDNAPRGAGDVAPMRIDQPGPALSALLAIAIPPATPRKVSGS